MMTEAGAHLSSIAAAADHNLPSIFEVVAQESLTSTLKPALQHVLRIAAERNVERFGKLYAYSDELYAAVQCLIESYYLKHYDASFSENFYNLRRVACSNAQNVSRSSSAADLAAESAVNHKDTMTATNVQHLTKADRRRSLFFLIAVPYIKSKLDRWYEQLSESTASSHRLIGVRSRLYQAFLAVYPLIHAVWEGTVLYFQLAFMFGKTECHSPLLYLASLMLRNLTEQEVSESLASSVPLRVLLTGKSRAQQVLLVLGKLLSWSSLLLSTSLSVGIFFLQFLQWWYTSDQRVAAMTSLPNPGPPTKQSVATSGDSRLINVCPLCNKLRVNDTALSVSGYVFCYQCIFKHVRDKACCPMTGYPTRSEHLIRIYRSDM